MDILFYIYLVLISLHLVYDNVLDLGEIPLKSEINEQDDVVELCTIPEPGLDYLAGAEQSWWRREFTSALKRLEMHDSIDRHQDTNVNCPTNDGLGNCNKFMHGHNVSTLNLSSNLTADDR